MLSEEEKKAIYKIERLVKYFEDWDAEYTVVPEDKKYFNSLLNLIEKQDKIIYEIAKAFKQDDSRSIDEIIEYFTNKVERNNK